MVTYLGVEGQQIVVVLLVEADKEMAKINHRVVQRVDEGWLDCSACLVSCALTELLSNLVTGSPLSSRSGTYKTL